MSGSLEVSHVWELVDWLVRKRSARSRIALVDVAGDVLMMNIVAQKSNYILEMIVFLVPCSLRIQSDVCGLEYAKLSNLIGQRSD